jgi:hypothetical protein
MFDPKAFPEKSASGGGSRVLPVGRHRVQIVSVEWDDLKATLAVTFAEPSGAGRSIRAWYPVEGPRAWLLATLLRAVGWPHAIDPRSSRSTGQALDGQELEVVVVENEWQGKVRTQVRYTNRLPTTSDRPEMTESPDDAPDADDDIPF